MQDMMIILTDRGFVCEVGNASNGQGYFAAVSTNWNELNHGKAARGYSANPSTALMNAIREWDEHNPENKIIVE